MIRAMKKNNDEQYWANYYGKDLAPEEPSNFAKYIAGRFDHEKINMIELGCGNGRDARFFAKHGWAVRAVDQCAPEITHDQSQEDNPGKLSYEVADFTTLEDVESPYDLVYSRFTLHSVGKAEQDRTLEWAQRNLTNNGLLCIETRGQKNEIYQKGQPVEGEPDAFIYDQHYRRFVEFNEFKRSIENTGFKIIESAEETGFAPFEGTDYHFIRIIAEKV